MNRITYQRESLEWLDVTEQYLELVREHMWRFRDAQVIYFPEWEPKRALIQVEDGVRWTARRS